MLDTFIQKALTVSSEVFCVKDKVEVFNTINSILSQELKDGDLALWAEGRLFTKEMIKGHCPLASTEINKEKASKALIGISEAQKAIANTGTLLFDSTDITGRMVSMLPLIHIAIIREDEIVSDMISALNTLSPSQIAYLSMITGPSRTADIERVLTIGVHGPQRLIIVVITKGGF